MLDTPDLEDVTEETGDISGNLVSRDALLLTNDEG